MRGKQWKKWIILPVAAGLLISQLVTQTVWAAELSEAVLESVEEVPEEEAAPEISEESIVEPETNIENMVEVPEEAVAGEFVETDETSEPSSQPIETDETPEESTGATETNPSQEEFPDSMTTEVSAETSAEPAEENKALEELDASAVAEPLEEDSEILELYGADLSTENGWYFNYEKAVGQILFFWVSGYEGKSKNLVIPTSVVYEGEVYPVKGIHPCAFQNSQIEKIIIPSSIESIGLSAFKDCSVLSEVTLNEGLKEIGAGAFENCVALTSITIPQSVTEIQSGAFSDCISLKTANVKTPCLDGEWIFKGDTSLTKVSIPDNTTTIGWGAFSRCTSLSTINCPSKLVKIESQAFYDCISLKDIPLREGIVEIGSYAFADCDGLETVTVPSTVVTLGEYAFWSCDSLQSVTINSRSISNGMFYECKMLQNVTFSERLTSIGEYAFEECDALESILIPVGVTRLSDSAFKKCDSLVSATIMSKEIGNSAFEDCQKLETVVFSNQLTSIGEAAFDNCSSLDGVVLPDSLLTLGDIAFIRCNSLHAITIPQKLKSIGIGAFADSGLETVTVHSKMTGDDMFRNCANLQKIILGDELITIAPFTFADNHNLTSVVLGENVKTIADHVFYNCDRLQEVTFNSKVESVGDYAFECCEALSSVRLPNTVRTLGKNCFLDCSGLQSIHIPISVTNIGENALFNTGLKKVYCEKGSKADNASLYPEGTRIIYGEPTVDPVSFKVVGVIGGRNVTFSSNTEDAVIYYSSTTSALTTQDACVKNGETILFENFYGTIYARAYENGVWGNVSRLILKIPVVNAPTISTDTKGDVTIRTSTPGSIIYYTIDGSTPTPSNGIRVGASSVTLPSFSGTLRAIAVRSCFTNSTVTSKNLINSDKSRNVAFTVKGVFGGREVTFGCDMPGAKVYYSTTTSKITTKDKCVNAGETVLFENFYGTVYARSYCNGEWGNVCRLILKIPVVNTPTITIDSQGYATIRTTTPGCYLYYTTDGSTPSMTNGKRVTASQTRVYVGRGVTVKAVAVRSCFTNSQVAERK